MTGPVRTDEVCPGCKVQLIYLQGLSPQVFLCPTCVQYLYHPMPCLPYKAGELVRRPEVF
jgi:hypothetical protein